MLRTLALFRADERVGYYGVVSLFTEPLQGRARSTPGKKGLTLRFVHVIVLIKGDVEGACGFFCWIVLVI